MNKKQRDLQKLVSYNGSIHFDVSGKIAAKKQHQQMQQQQQMLQQQQTQQYY